MQNLVKKFLSALLSVCLILSASSCEAESTEPEPPAASETTAVSDEAEEMDIFLNIRIQTPDGTVYESADDGETWFVNGEPSEKPALSAFFIGELPVPLSEGCKLYVYNDTETDLYYGEEYRLLRESGGEWIPAALADGDSIVFLQLLYTLPKKIRWRFPISTEMYEPITGSYRYVKEFWEDGESQIDGTPYTVILEFPAAAEEQAETPAEPVKSTDENQP